LRPGKRTEGGAGDEILPISKYLATPTKNFHRGSFLYTMGDMKNFEIPVAGNAPEHKEEPCDVVDALNK
jgi:hypothetical protein